MAFWEREVVGMTFSQLAMNMITATILVLIGIVLGKFVNWIILKYMQKAKIEKTRGFNFLGLFVTIIKWAIYIIFVNLALERLGVPEFTSWLTNVLVVIPALVGGLLLIVVGFAIASYLKDTIAESKIEGWKMLSKIFFFFINYVFLVFAFKTVLISFDKSTVNWLLIILSAIVGIGVVYWQVRGE